MRDFTKLSKWLVALCRCAGSIICYQKCVANECKFSALANVNTFIFILGCNDNKFDASAQVNTNSYIELMSTYNTKQQHHNKTLAAGYGGHV